MVEKIDITKPKDITLAKNIINENNEKASDIIETVEISENEIKEERKKKNIKKYSIIFSIVAIIIICIIVVLCVIFIKPKQNEGKIFKNSYKTVTTVGYSAEYLGTIKRRIPSEVKDEGLESGYPKYSYTKSLTTEEKEAILTENYYLCATPTSGASGTYDKMDAEGNLYLNGELLNRKIYKHSASVEMYMGDVSNDEPGVIKKITMKKRGYNGYGITGLYAPAGEVIKIEISETDMNNTGGITIHIGQALYNGQANDIWTARDFNRMPVILNTMNVDKNTARLENGMYTAYIGSYIGGPIYIRNEEVTFTVIISGAVNYSHFILGYTTEEEFNKNANSTAPYFDLEVWEYGVLHSGPKKYAENFTYEDIYKAAILWDKISLVSTQVTAQGIVFLYDPFIAAGAAVAFQGRRSVNCPLSWMTDSLNYDTFIESGAWGNVHEYNHNFQSGWGRGDGGEVTNNALSLVSYSLFTKISSARKIGVSGEGITDWNKYTNASWSLIQALNKAENPLREYAVLLHNFGQDMFIKSIKTQHANSSFGVDYAGYYMALSTTIHNDMTYFFNEILGANLDESITLPIKEKGYPMFVPISSIYQTGRSYIYDEKKRYIETMQPYVIEYDKDFDIDLSPYIANTGGSIVLPNGFSYKIKSISQPEYGTIIANNDNKYIYKPEKLYARSGKVYVTLEITKEDRAFEVDDVDLILEFEQSHEKNKNILERTIYEYSEENLYTDPTDAYENNYANYIKKTDKDNINGTQNGNAEIWFTDNDPAPLNNIMEIRGKIYVTDNGKYRIALRGRRYAALYVSFDEGNNYSLAVNMVNKSEDPNFILSNPNNYKDYEDLKAGQWIYFKAILIVNYYRSFIGVGWGKFEENNESETVNVTYVNAYRSSYEFPNKQFVTDYFYTREYIYNYIDKRIFEEKQTLVSTNYKPWTSGVAEGTHKIENLFDGNPETNIHTVQNVFISENNPFEITIDLGEAITANEITLYGNTATNVGIGNLGMPKTFKVYGCLDLKEQFQIIAEYENEVHNTRNITFSFGDSKTFRYFKLFVTKTDNERYLALNRIGFSNTFLLPNGKLISPDRDMFVFKGNWEIISVPSSFGHVYSGKKHSTMDFHFIGTRFALLSYTLINYNYQVYIDGKLTNTIDLKIDTNPTVVTYLSPELKDGNHSVTIKCTNVITIDSIVLWE